MKTNISNRSSCNFRIETHWKSSGRKWSSTKDTDGWISAPWCRLACVSEFWFCTCINGSATTDKYYRRCTATCKCYINYMLQPNIVFFEFEIRVAVRVQGFSCSHQLDENTWMNLSGIGAPTISNFYQPNVWSRQRFNKLNLRAGINSKDTTWYWEAEIVSYLTNYCYVAIIILLRKLIVDVVAAV